MRLLPGPVLWALAFTLSSAVFYGTKCSGPRRKSPNPLPPQLRAQLRFLRSLNTPAQNKLLLNRRRFRQLTPMDQRYLRSRYALWSCMPPQNRQKFKRSLQQLKKWPVDKQRRLLFYAIMFDHLPPLVRRHFQDLAPQQQLAVLIELDRRYQHQQAHWIFLGPWTLRQTIRKFTRQNQKQLNMIIFMAPLVAKLPPPLRQRWYQLSPLRRREIKRRLSRLALPEQYRRLFFWLRH